MSAFFHLRYSMNTSINPKIIIPIITYSLMSIFIEFFQQRVSYQSSQKNCDAHFNLIDY
jgi:hypothetical protein